jgi:hypothetical protein
MPVTHLFVQELPGILLDVALVQVGRQAHKPHLGEAEICKLDVTHGGDEEAADMGGSLRGWASQGTGRE